jgi:hypothetical protein
LTQAGLALYNEMIAWSARLNLRLT